MYSHGRIGAGVGVNLVPWPPVQHSPYAYPAQAAAYAGAYPVWQVQGGPQLYTEQDYGGGFAGADARTQMMVLSAARKTAAPAMVRAAARKTAAPAMVRAKKARRRAKKARFSQPGAVPTDCGVWCVEQYCADPVLKDGKFQCPTDWQNFMVSGCIDKWCRGQVPSTPNPSSFAFAGADARTRAMVGAAARRRQKSQIYGKILPDCGGFLDCQPCERPQYDKCGFPVGRPPGRRPVPGRPGGGGNGRIPGGGGGVTLCPDGRLPDANGRCPHSVPMPTPTPTPYPGGGGVPDVWQQPWATPQPQPAPVPQYPIGVFQSAAALGCPAGFVPDGAGGCTPVVG